MLCVSSVDYLGKSVIAFNNHLLSFSTMSKQLKKSQGPLDNVANKYDWPVNDRTVKSVIYMYIDQELGSIKGTGKNSQQRHPFLTIVYKLLHERHSFAWITWLPPKFALLLKGAVCGSMSTKFDGWSHGKKLFIQLCKTCWKPWCVIHQTIMNVFLTIHKPSCSDEAHMYV